MSLRRVPEWLKDSGEWDASVQRLAPTTDIFDAPCRCISFNGEWASFISGVLERYTHPGAWLGDNDDKQRGTESLEKLLASMGYCDVVKNVRVYNGKIQVYINGEWADASDDGSLDEKGSVPEANLSAFTNKRCVMSTWIRDEAEELADNAADSIDSIGDAATAVVTLVGQFSSWGIIFAQIVIAVNAVLDAGSGWFQANSGIQFWDDVQCALHCNLDETNPQYTRVVHETWLLDVAALGAAGTILSWILGGVGYDHLRYIAWRSQFAESDDTCGFCSSCEPWEHTIDFTAVTGDGYCHILDHGTAGSWITSTGWNATWVVDNAHNNGDRLSLYIPMPADAVVTSVQVQDTVGSIYGKSFRAFLDPSTAQCYDVDTPVYENLNVNSADPLITLGGVECDTLVFWWLHTSNVDIRITSITIFGTGENPYV